MFDAHPCHVCLFLSLSMKEENYSLTRTRLCSFMSIINQDEGEERG
jgi:hypothetical protein